MKKLIKTMAAVTAAVLTLSFVACSYDGNVNATAGVDREEVDVAEYADNLMKEKDEGGD